jgi:hypothetical protein
MRVSSPSDVTGTETFSLSTMQAKILWQAFNFYGVPGAAAQGSVT